MPKSILSTLVFVGKEFNTSMIDERRLVDMFGPFKGDQIKAGPVGQFHYENDGTRLSVTPDRIDIRQAGREILPQSLVLAGGEVAQQVEPIRGFISAVGINCELVLYSQEIGKEGKDFCTALTATPLFQQVCSQHPPVDIHSVTYAFSGIAIEQYNIRLEPEHRTQGRNLFVSLNAHQNIIFSDNLQQKLEAIEEVRGQVELLHRQILATKGE